MLTTRRLCPCASTLKRGSRQLGAGCAFLGLHVWTKRLVVTLFTLQPFSMYQLLFLYPDQVKAARTTRQFDIITGD
jgi:hypothetical protein